jgi:hypothetical protein
VIEPDLVPVGLMVIDDMIDEADRIFDYVVNKQRKNVLMMGTPYTYHIGVL